MLCWKLKLDLTLLVKFRRSLERIGPDFVIIITLQEREFGLGGSI